MSTLTVSFKSKTLLDGILQSGRIANAYLFTGSVGAFSAEASRYFSCRIQGVDQPPSTDYFELKKEGSIVIDDIRHLHTLVAYGPSSHPWFTVLIHSADRMTTEAANAFLKLLEEPPSGVVFILLTHQGGRILSTIRSRCQSLYLPPLGESEWAPILSGLAAQPDIPEFLATSPYLTALYLETGTQLDAAQMVSLEDVLSMNLADRLTLSQQLAKDKDALFHLLWHWLSTVPSDLPPDVATTIQQSILSALDLFHVNLNLRLHLDTMFLFFPMVR